MEADKSGESSKNENAVGKPSSWKDHIKETWMTEDVAGLSKNKQKKLLKRKLWEERRLEKRQAERQRKKEKRAEMREAGLALPKRIRARDMATMKYSDLRIVLDLDFYDLMNANDVRMVLSQLRDCYSLNRKVEEPFQITVTSFCDRYKTLLSTLQPGYVNWKMTMSPDSYLDTFENKNLVYLTADSDNVLETLEENKLYVIGGLVDHNQHKYLCYNRAQQNGIAHAQLPISQYVKMSTRKVLTINHVFEILLQYKETKDWKKAFFKVIPKRKGIDEIDEDNVKVKNDESKEDDIEDEKIGDSGVEAEKKDVELDENS